MSISWQMASLLLLGGSMLLLFIGLPVAFSFIAINIIGALIFLGGDASRWVTSFARWCLTFL
jgi:hypothetical protein